MLEPLVKHRPDNVQYRLWLIRAYWGRPSSRKSCLAELKRADAYFHEQGRWQEPVMAALARSCLDNGLFEQSAAYYEEVIPLHQRTQPNRGIGNGTLSTTTPTRPGPTSAWARRPRRSTRPAGRW